MKNNQETKKMKKKESLQAMVAKSNSTKDAGVKTPTQFRRLPSLAKRYTPEEIEASIRRNFGTLTYTCLDLDCTISQLTHYLKEHPEMKLVKQEARAAIVDLAEKTIVESMKEGNLNAAIYTAKTLGRDRGWSEQAVLNVNVMNDAEKAEAVKRLFGMPEEEEEAKESSYNGTEEEKVVEAEASIFQNPA